MNFYNVNKYLQMSPHIPHIHLIFTFGFSRLGFTTSTSHYIGELGGGGSLHIVYTKISRRDAPALWDNVPSIDSDNSGQENTQAGCVPSSCTVFPGQETQRDSNQEEGSILLPVGGSGIIQSGPTWKALLSTQWGRAAVKPRRRFGVHCSLTSSVVPLWTKSNGRKINPHRKEKQTKKKTAYFHKFLFCFVFLEQKPRASQIKLSESQMWARFKWKTHPVISGRTLLKETGDCGARRRAFSLESLSRTVRREKNGADEGPACLSTP